MASFGWRKAAKKKGKGQDVAGTLAFGWKKRAPGQSGSIRGGQQEVRPQIAEREKKLSRKKRENAAATKRSLNTTLN